MSAYARHIKNGRTLPYVVAAEQTLERALTAGLICAACGRPFNDKRKPSATDASLCAECRAAL